MITLTDKNENIIQPRDTIVIETSKGKLLGKIVSLSESKVKVKIKNKVKNLVYKTFKNRIKLYEAAHTYRESEENIQPLLTEMLEDTKATAKKDKEPLTINEMFDKYGIRAIPALKPTDKFEYNRTRLVSLINEAKTFTRDYNEFLPLTEKFNQMLKYLNNK